MEPSQFFFIVLPLAFLISILVVIVIYLSKKSEETEYEKEMKRLRQLLLKGQIDRNSFLCLRDKMKLEENNARESQRLDNMIRKKEMDSETYVRMKKVLQHGFNERIEKINLKYNIETKKSECATTYQY